MWNLNNPYQYRADNLRRMGFKSYYAYRNSDLWKSIRERALARTKGRCQRCGASQHVHVHHRAYDPATLKGENLDALSPLCRKCHGKAELPSVRRHPNERLQSANKVANSKWFELDKWARENKHTLPAGLSREQMEQIRGFIPKRHKHPNRWLRAKIGTILPKLVKK